MNKLKPKDIIAILTIVLIAILKFTGHNGALDTAVALILGYYFAHREMKDDKGD